MTLRPSFLTVVRWRNDIGGQSEKFLLFIKFQLIQNWPLPSKSTWNAAAQPSSKSKSFISSRCADTKLAINETCFLKKYRQHRYVIGSRDKKCISSEAHLLYNVVTMGQSHARRLSHVRSRGGPAIFMCQRREKKPVPQPPTKRDK